MIWALTEQAQEGGWRGPLIALGIGVVIIALIEIVVKRRS